MMYQDVDLIIRFAANLPESWLLTEALEGRTDEAVFNPQHAAKVISTKRSVIDSGTATKMEILHAVEHERHWFMLNVEPDVNSAGDVIGVFTTIIDIDDLKYRETVLKTLLRELSHRSKNLLAIIQSVASQTARYSQGLDDFLLAFRNRVQSMAQSQDLITESDWRGAELFTLTKSQLQPLMGELPASFTMVGLDAYLLPNAALHLGLALHELTIDSLARGAMGPAGGTVRLSAQESKNDEGEPVLIVTWSEAFATGPDQSEIRPTAKNGFSGTVLGRIVPQALSAVVRHETGTDRMIYQLTIPDTQYEVSSRR
ncbi:HWE histidine kinase domain-containing protein [Hoeflea sp. YIM 152468]|uniref:sensor histidine kinase n=1 Tax=Hoeflea sp. YIM 152468 TaxID=3031759 RepID=UPI0023DA0A3C|nr:PAS domain-containing sensor histidine kinase [Hoeflea sp. YIM 152468]MDF1606916.1 HWE histidine kinase domain-containing protein [Hoeflea sp. YIM 152468]